MYLYFICPPSKCTLQEQQQCFVALHCILLCCVGNCISCDFYFISVHCCCCCCLCGAEEVRAWAWEPRSQNHKSEKRLSSTLMYLSVMIFLSLFPFLSFACNMVFNYYIGDKYNYHEEDYCSDDMDDDYYVAPLEFFIPQQ